MRFIRFVESLQWKMEDGGAVFSLLLLFALPVPSSTVTHALWYLYTAVTPRGNLPEFIAVGLVDEVPVMYYDSSQEKLIPKTEWIQKITADDKHYWGRETIRIQEHQQHLKISLEAAMQIFNQNKGNHTLQNMCGCERDEHNTTRGYDQFGYDGEDFFTLDLKTGTWTAVKSQSEIVIKKWDPRGEDAKYWKDFLENDCMDSLVKLSSQIIERKVPPEMSLFQKHSSSPELVCHATGFFPKSVVITWQKDGGDVSEDVEVRETLPNQDGTFQKRSILKVPAEDLQKHTYTCVIQHSSLGEELVLPVSERRILRGGGSGGGSDGIFSARSGGRSDGRSGGGSGGGSDGKSSARLGGGSDGGSGGGSGGGSEGGSDGGLSRGRAIVVVIVVGVIVAVVILMKRRMNADPPPVPVTQLEPLNQQPGSDSD